MGQNGRDEEGILGFLPTDIKKELSRGRKLVQNTFRMYQNLCNRTQFELYHSCEWFFWNRFAFIVKEKELQFTVLVERAENATIFLALWIMAPYINFIQSSSKKKKKNLVSKIAWLWMKTKYNLLIKIRSFCCQHRRAQIVPTAALKTTEKFVCIMCQEDIESTSSLETVWAACCKTTWFHRLCVQVSYY